MYKTIPWCAAIFIMASQVQAATVIPEQGTHASCITGLVVGGASYDVVFDSTTKGFEIDPDPEMAPDLFPFGRSPVTQENQDAAEETARNIASALNDRLIQTVGEDANPVVWYVVPYFPPSQTTAAKSWWGSFKLAPNEDTTSAAGCMWPKQDSGMDPDPGVMPWEVCVDQAVDTTTSPSAGAPAWVTMRTPSTGTCTLGSGGGDGGDPDSKGKTAAVIQTIKNLLLPSTLPPEESKK